MSWRSKSSKTPATQVKRVSTGTRSLAQERVAQDLKGADLRGADLSFTNLNGRSLEGADLAGATLKGAYMTGANLAGTDLTGVDLSGACLDKVKSADIVGSPEFLPDGRWRLVAGYLIGPEANLRKALLSRATPSPMPALTAPYSKEQTSPIVIVRAHPSVGRAIPLIYQVQT